MTQLKSNRQELFAQYVADGASYSSAYRKAGYSCRNPNISGNASAVAHRPGMQARISELIKERQEQLRGEVDRLFENGADVNSPEVRYAVRMWIIKSLHRSAQMAGESGKVRDLVHALQALAAFTGIEGASDVRMRADRDLDSPKVQRRGARPSNFLRRGDDDDQTVAPRKAPKFAPEDLAELANRFAELSDDGLADVNA